MIQIYCNNSVFCSQVGTYCSCVSRHSQRRVRHQTHVDRRQVLCVHVSPTTKQTATVDAKPARASRLRKIRFAIQPVQGISKAFMSRSCLRPSVPAACDAQPPFVYQEVPLIGGSPYQKLPPFILLKNPPDRFPLVIFCLFRRHHCCGEAVDASTPYWRPQGTLSCHLTGCQRAQGECSPAVHAQACTNPNADAASQSGRLAQGTTAPECHQRQQATAQS
jgi:hypothetical protein